MLKFQIDKTMKKKIFIPFIVICVVLFSFNVQAQLVSEQNLPLPAGKSDVNRVQPIPVSTSQQPEISLEKLPSAQQPIIPSDSKGNTVKLQTEPAIPDEGILVSEQKNLPSK
jgi:hypothetical protein